ncbi:MAG TPA: HIT domain-containing protein [Candidatus Binataceae bacterium]|nr:HIT domain-containing protein [Candidatus Binataceae bacterium]
MARRTPPRRARPEGAGAGCLWAPWRSAYITRARAGGARCIFCFGRLGERGRRQRLVLHADPLALVMLNRYPYASGHILIAPRRHVASPEMLTAAELAATSAIIARAVAHLRAAYRPDGLNLGANLGRAAGAGIADHMHWHVVPRWEGDTNFMPVIGSTRVLPQALEETYALLGPHFQAAGAALT